MSAVDQILSQLPIDDIAARLGTDPATATQAARAALPALLGGLQANAQDPAGEASLAEALTQHDPALVEGGVDLDAVDAEDGARITRHIFGDSSDQVVSQLGSVGGDKGLVAKLLPILAPIVLAYLAKQVGGSAKDSGALGQVLSQVLAGASEGAGKSSAGGGLGDLLGGLLGGLLGQGRR